MDFLSKLLKNTKVEKAAKDLLRTLTENPAGSQAVDPTAGAAGNPSSGPKRGEAPGPRKTSSGADGYGRWWGPEMPAEENQYNYPGYFLDYFKAVFAEEFPQYRIDCKVQTGRPAAVFTFYDGDRQALVVELLSEKSSAKLLRARCEAAGMPYLRYYYDHEGWWNTRSYVVSRTRRALGID